MKNTYPDRQVWNIISDGAFPVAYPDVITNARHKLSVINVVPTNLEYAFVKNKYKNTNGNLFGTSFTNVDYAQISEVQGVKGFTASRIEGIDRVVQEVVAANEAGHIVAVDCKITIDCPIPVEILKPNLRLFSELEISAYCEKYEAQYPVSFREFLEAEGLESRYIKQVRRARG